MRLLSPSAVAPILVLAVLALGSCGGDDTQPEKGSAPTDTPSEEQTPEPVNFGVGEPVTAPGFVMTIKKVDESPQILVNETDYISGSPNARFTPRKPDDGGKFVILRTRIENKAQESFDLTCAFPIDIKVFNTESQQYDPIENLYEIKGNPECNDQLQPGFKDRMTYAFMVPETAKIVGALVDVGAVGNIESDPQIVALDESYKGTLSFD